MLKDNPASRLLDILREGKQINQKTNAKSAWKAILKVEHPDTIQGDLEFTVKLGKFMMLPQEVLDLIERYYPSQKGSLIHAVTTIQQAISAQNLNGSWDTFITRIDSHTLSNLDMASALLSRELNCELVDEKQLENIRSRLTKLSKDIAQAKDLPESFKRFITHHIQKILDAIRDYFVSGVMPIFDALNAAVGLAVIDPSYKSNLTGTSYGNTFGGVLSDLANIVTIGAAATSAALFLAENGIPFLG